ncbi:MAG: carboxypeptidase-like regulatory domain-containing protein [Weeksellaceae bacterium]|nr:carboxypeptidase-like regulatory domain-containing protein [Weeksellaceae bacterium]
MLFLISFGGAAQVEREKKLEEVVLKKGKSTYKNKKENPAYAIMQEVWKRKRNNGLQKFKTYTFKEYEKIEFDIANIDSAFMDRKVFKKLDFIFDYVDSADNGRLALPVFLNESIYTNFGQNEPSKKQKRLLIAQKTSGFEDNQIVTLTAKNLYKEIDIYDNIINYFDIGFQSPVSRDGFSTYNYELMDTISVNGQEVFRIRYEPKRSDVLAFQGQLYISTDHYAVTQATLRSTKKMNVNFVNGIFTELEYDNPDENTFLPKKYRTSLDLSPFSKNKTAKSLVATRSVDYSEYIFNPPLTDADFEARESEMTEDFVKKDDAYWQSARTDSLSQKEKGIYEMLDRLEDTPKFQRIAKAYETFASGYYNVGKAIDIGDLYSIYGRNEVEGDRIRLGGRTYFSQNDDWRIQGYGAYGFRDRKFKYGAEAKYMCNKINRFTVGAGSRRDVMQLGVQLTTDDGIMSRSFASSSVFGRGENASLSSVSQTNVFAAVDPLKNLTVRLDGTLQSIKSANEEGFNLYYHDNDGMLRKTVNDSHLTLSLIARPGAKFSQTGVDRYEHSTLAPTIVLKYTRGLENLFNADYGYNKLQFMFYKPMLIGSWGKSFFSFEAGKNFDPVPLALQNVIPGNQSYSLVTNTFSQLNYYEFVADTYTTAHLEHHFNGKILSFIPLIKKLKLREVAFIRGAYGTLSEESKAINVEGYKYSAPDRNIYYEYGFGIENIGFGNLRLFRVDFNWRGNYLQDPNASKFGIKAGIQFFY